VAEIRVAAATESEMKEKKARYESAHNAVKAALEEGILPGGGVALARAAAVLDDLRVPRDEKIGVAVLRNALSAPLKQIARNAGLEGAVVLRRVLAEEGNVGFDVVAETYGDLYELGVIDPTKVTKAALANAASVAGILLMSDCLVTEAPEEDDEEEGHHHHH